MKAYLIKYDNGKSFTTTGHNALEIIKRYDLCTKEHINTRVIELAGEQEAIVFSNLE